MLFQNSIEQCFIKYGEMSRCIFQCNSKDSFCATCLNLFIYLCRYPIFVNIILLKITLDSNKKSIFVEKSNSNDISTTGDISVIVVVVSAVCAFCIVILFILMFGCSRFGHKIVF